jgi:hypothetical protein
MYNVLMVIGNVKKAQGTEHGAQGKKQQDRKTARPHDGTILFPFQDNWIIFKNHYF